MKYLKLMFSSVTGMVLTGSCNDEMRTTKDFQKNMIFGKTKK
jgi:hypothetical protein